MSNKQSSIEWLFQNMFEISQVLYTGEETQYELMMEAYQQAKAMHNQEHGKTWDDSLDNLKARGMNEMRAYADFDDYYNETFGGNNENI